MQLPTNHQTGILVVSAIASSVTFLVYFMLIGGFSFIPAVVLSLICALLTAALIYFFLMSDQGSKIVRDASVRIVAVSKDTSEQIGEAVSKTKRKAMEAKDARAEAKAVASQSPIPSQDSVQPEPSEVQKKAEAVEPQTTELDAASSSGGVEPTKPIAPVPTQDGKGDDLKLIRGIGPKLETTLKEMGFTSFDQIAKWNDAEVAWVDENLPGFKGRASRDDWVEQAKALASHG